jgi:hypothetical protein
MTDTAFVIVECYDALIIRTRGSYPQEIRIRLGEVPALVTDIIRVLPRDKHGAAVIDQVIAAARARRPRDRTNAERQRRFRQRRRAQHVHAKTIGKESTPV